MKNSEEFVLMLIPESGGRQMIRRKLGGVIYDILRKQSDVVLWWICAKNLLERCSNIR